jgi:SAM-dependent methyltransferase
MVDDFFDSEENVEKYVEMADGYDGEALIAELKNHLPAGASVLELGMGPGKDLDILAETYQVCGSDRSAVFLERYRRKQPQADLLRLDAVTLETERTFDAIYSNKVLHHLTRADLAESFRQQAARLNGGGLLFHSFWYGDKVESFSGMEFMYYTEETLHRVIGPELEQVKSEIYTEMEDSDSFFVILKKR